MGIFNFLWDGRLARPLAKKTKYSPHSYLSNKCQNISLMNHGAYVDP